MLLLQALEPDGLAWAEPLGLGLFHEPQAPATVAIAHRHRVASLVQPFGRVLPHWFQQPVPRRIVTRNRDQRFINELPQQVQYLLAGNSFPGADRLSRLEGPRSNEH